jgi:hypothetical protein
MYVKNGSQNKLKINQNLSLDSKHNNRQSTILKTKKIKIKRYFYNKIFG